MSFPSLKTLLASGALSGMLIVLAYTGQVWGEDETPLVDSPDVVFGKLDKNNDGKLTREEAGEEGKSSFERLLRVGDKDGDGILSRTEFMAASRPQEKQAPRNSDRDATRPNRQKPASESEKPGRQNQPGQPGAGGNDFDPGEFAKRLDRNQDGKLSLDELPERMQERARPIYVAAGKTELTIAEFGAAMAKQMGDSMPARPARQNFQQLFKRFDANENGKLTLEEIPEAMRERFQPIFERLGKDELPFETIQSAMGQSFQGQNPNANPPGTPALGGGQGIPGGGRGPGIGGPPMFFQKLDTNGDGKLSRDELGKLAEQFADFDRNEDGGLDLRELMGGRGGSGMERRPDQPAGEATPQGRPNRPRRPDSEPAASPESKPSETPARRPEGDAGSPRARLQRLDTNGDGKLSKDETRGRLKENFDRIDKNRDGFLSVEELRQAVETLGGQRNGGKANKTRQKLA